MGKWQEELRSTQGWADTAKREAATGGRQTGGAGGGHSVVLSFSHWKFKETPKILFLTGVE